ncbi:hypothetical protein N0V93_009814 [Gnomoniopsis smithogilvyi]|uniref:Cyclochlorotine biosynthesis protein O n=1 Tax=Gnomoniopsis smithogilvyi TaxID=1191159 RepID=A0A9W8YIM8_9PEZI|nr:hypothetical protein N0V93_009814 [Gnomoniopsis smithogilvyi]
MDTATNHHGSFDRETQPFLEFKNHTLPEPAATSGQQSCFVSFCPSAKVLLLAHLLLFILNICILTPVVYFGHQHYVNKHSVSTVWSPAENVIEWEARVIDAIPGSTLYTGYPTPESDAAWTDLLRGINLRILPDEMKRLGYTSLALKDGSGYVGSLGVYHELHCLKRVRKMLYRDYYYPDMTAHEAGHRMGHLEHCLEQIRQSSICHGDINVIPYSWLRDENNLTALPTMQFGSLHQCVNWEKLDGWAKARRVDLFDENLLKPADLAGEHGAED